MLEWVIPSSRRRNNTDDAWLIWLQKARSGRGSPLPVTVRRTKPGAGDGEATAGQSGLDAGEDRNEASTALRVAVAD
jgi:hypothetical protein